MYLFTKVIVKKNNSLLLNYFRLNFYFTKFFIRKACVQKIDFAVFNFSFTIDVIDFLERGALLSATSQVPNGRICQPGARSAAKSKYPRKFN